MIDIKDKIEEVTKKVKDDPSIAKNFEKEPVKTVEGIVGVDLPDDVINKVVDGVKANLGKAEIANTVALARKLLAKGWASTLQCTLTIPYPGTPLFKELQANDGLTTLDWDEYDQRRAITKTPKVTESDIKCAIRDVYRGFLQPGALWALFRANLFDIGFYYRGVRYLIGHLLDFRG